MGSVNPPGRRSRSAKARKSPARRGRPPATAVNLRDRLLDAALACFARDGIAATSLSRVAAAAQVTPAMVTYYFGDKRRLQQVVVGERVLPAFQQVRTALEQADDTAWSIVEAFVNGVAATVAKHPWLPQLWIREVLCEGGVLRPIAVRELAPQLPRAMAARFAAARDRGELSPDLDPRLLVVSLVGLTLFPAASAPVWRAMFACDDIDATTLPRHALTLLRRGMEQGDDSRRR